MARNKRHKVNDQVVKQDNQDVHEDTKQDSNQYATDIATGGSVKDPPMELWERTKRSLDNQLLPLLTSDRACRWLLSAQAPGFPVGIDRSMVSESSDRSADHCTHHSANGHAKPDINGSEKNELLSTSQQLFEYIECLAMIQDSLKSQNQNLANPDSEDQNLKLGPCSLSGLTQLYTGIPSSDSGINLENDSKDKLQNEPLVDVETIWGQIELQNAALIPRLKKRLKRLAKAATSAAANEDMDDKIQLLDMGVTLSEDESEDQGLNQDAIQEMNEDQDEENDQIESENDLENCKEDQNAKRILQRMEKAMADMDYDVNENDEREMIGYENDENEDEDPFFGMVDTTREQMRDGFFDLHEMEAFADEEEDYLPRIAYGEERPEDVHDKGDKEKKMPPHVRQRTGRDDDEEDDDEFDDELSKRYDGDIVRRKKYRRDDEIDALHQLYDSSKSNQLGPKKKMEHDAVVDMTAADFFGVPDPAVVQKYQSNKDNENAGNLDKDADSWDDHNFANDGMDWKGDPENDDEHGKSSDNDDDNVQNINSSSHHARQQQSLQKQTQKLERELLAEAPWKMKGEATSNDRPSDSLLHSTPEFEVAFKPPPILTSEHSSTIEELIKRRILEDDYDDVLPRELPDIGNHRRSVPPEVSQERSRLGLGELYERDYLKRTTGYDRTQDEIQTQTDQAHDEIKSLFAKLCQHLDALSNYQFVPRPVADDVDVKTSDVPAIAMEETLPLYVSDKSGLAPEELYDANKRAGRGGVLKGPSELDQAERKRLRNAKKAARRKARKQKQADEKLVSKARPSLGLNNPYEKRKLRQELEMARASGRVVNQNHAGEVAGGKEYTTSAKFFEKMQEVTSALHDDHKLKNKQQKVVTQPSSAYKL